MSDGDLEARVRGLRARSEEALGDLPTAGLVGMAALRGCARVYERLERLDGTNAAETLAALRATARELDMIGQALEKGLHPDALRLALGRTRTVALAAVTDLAAALGEAP
jgi:hypothetical protein